MNIFIKKTVTFAMLLGILCIILNFLLVDNIHAYTRMMLEEMYHYEGNIDVLFIGSSHTYRSYDTDLANTLLGKNTFNAGSSGQHWDGSYYLLKEALKYHNLETVYLDTYFSVAQYSASGANKAQYILSDYMRWSKNKISFLWNVGGIDAVIDSIIPFRRNIRNLFKSYKMIECVKLKLTDGFQIGNYEHISYNNEEYRGNGFVYSFEIASKRIDNAPERTIPAEKPISDYSYEYLCKIVQLCKNEGIELILVSAPMTDEMLSRVDGLQYYIDFISEFAQRNNIEYYNFNLCREEYLSLKASDFRDKHHLNGQGAEKFTKAFCSMVKMLSNDNSLKENIFYDTYNDKSSSIP